MHRVDRVRRRDAHDALRAATSSSTTIRTGAARTRRTCPWYAGCFHPNISGPLARLEQVALLLDSILERGDVWVATLGQIAAHVQELIATWTWSPRVVDVELTEPERS